MITLEQYFGGKPHTPEHEDNATVLLDRVKRLCEAMKWDWPVDPDTGTCISGSRGGSGDGGFRTPDSKTGSPNSSHKEAKAVDVYDPGNRLDGMLTDEILEEYGLYREHPDATPGWCHLTIRPPRSGRRTFYP